MASIDQTETDAGTGRTLPQEIRGEGVTERILQLVWRKINRRNEHFMFAVVGREGSGKSLTAMKIARCLDPTFNEDRVMFKTLGLLERLHSGNHEPGQCYVLDEAGVSLGSRTWQDRSQVLANQALQLIRDHNLGLIFTIPATSDLDSQAERRLHGFYEIRKKREDEYVSGSWQWIDPGRTPKNSSVYTKRPKMNGQRVDIVRFAPPDYDFIERYKEQKRAFQKEHYDMAIEQLREDDPTIENTDEDAQDEWEDPQEIVGDILDGPGVDHYVSSINNGTQHVLEQDQIAADYDIGERRSKRVKSLLKREVEREVL